MKEVKITPPEGFEVDKEKSTFEKIVFKPVKKNRNWVDFPISVCGYCIGPYPHSNINYTSGTDNKNVWPTKELAEAALALSQLMQWRKVYLIEYYKSNPTTSWKMSHHGWLEPDWEDENVPKHCLYYSKNFEDPQVQCFVFIRRPISFPTEKLAEDFREEFKDLLETAKPLL